MQGPGGLVEVVVPSGPAATEAGACVASRAGVGRVSRRFDEWLLADREAPRTQRQTARRVFERLRDEHGCEAAETTVRRHVRARRRALGLAGEGFVPQAYAPAAGVQVDWGEAHVVLARQRTRVFLFGMRACWWGAAYWIPLRGGVGGVLVKNRALAV